jgi:hypothetical protein
MISTPKGAHLVWHTYGRHDTTVDVAVALAWGAESGRANVMVAIEVKGDDVANCGCHGAGREGIAALADLNSVGSGICTGHEGEKRESADHLDELYKEWMG